MKFTLLFAFALIGCAAAIQVLDSATQGPNPQDIATPEPEYIDIDEPPPAAAPAPIQTRSSFASVSAPIQARSSFASVSAPIQTRSSFASVSAPIQTRSSFSVAPHPVQRPFAVSSFARSPSQSYLAPQRSFGGVAQLPGHSFSQQSGYQYRRPVYVRRAYRRRF